MGGSLAERVNGFAVNGLLLAELSGASFLSFNGGGGGGGVYSGGGDLAGSRERGGLRTGAHRQAKRLELPACHSGAVIDAGGDVVVHQRMMMIIEVRTRDPVGKAGDFVVLGGNLGDLGMAASNCSNGIRNQSRIVMMGIVD